MLGYQPLKTEKGDDHAQAGISAMKAKRLVGLMLAALVGAGKADSELVVPSQESALQPSEELSYLLASVGLVLAP
eukprot:6941701-Alexandrium_andersonii.AAC.1